MTTPGKILGTVALVIASATAALVFTPVAIVNPAPIYHMGFFNNDGTQNDAWTNFYTVSFFSGSNLQNWQPFKPQFEIYRGHITFVVTNGSPQNYFWTVFTSIP